jgi:N-carbamoylputrescine amidase
LSRTLCVALVQDSTAAVSKPTLAASRPASPRPRQPAHKLVLLQELHNGAYFCQHESVDEFDRAEPIPGPSTERLGALAARHGWSSSPRCSSAVPGPVPQHRVVLDADGRLAGRTARCTSRTIRASGEVLLHAGRPGLRADRHLGRPPGRAGLLGPVVPGGRAPDGLAGAELLLYPTAIGWDPRDEEDEQDRQRRPGSSASAATRSPTACRC